MRNLCIARRMVDELFDPTAVALARNSRWWVLETAVNPSKPDPTQPNSIELDCVAVFGRCVCISNGGWNHKS